MNWFLNRYGWNILLFICLFFISLFSLNIVDMYTKASRISEQSIDGLSEVSVQFVIDTYDTLNFDFLDEVNGEYVLMQSLSEEMPLYRVAYTRNFFEMEAGNSFDETILSTQQEVFICGNKADKLTEIEPFVFKDKEYVQIGVLRNGNTIATEYGIFVSEGSEVDNWGNKEWILEGNTQHCVDKVYKAIRNKMENDGYSVNLLDKKESKLNDVHNISDVGLTIVILSLFFLSSSIILIEYFWLGQYDEFRQVYFLLGLRNIEQKICMDFAKILLLGFGVAVIIGRIDSRRVVLYTFIILFTIIGFILWWCLRWTRKGACDEKNMG